MRFAFALTIVAFGCAALAWHLASPTPASALGALLLGWVALSAAIVAAGYAGIGAKVFGKSSDGQRALWARVLLLPYFTLVAFARWLQRTVTGERPFDEVAPGLYVGRLVPTRTLPRDVRLVVDLTAELTEPLQTRQSYEYRCLPTLDGMAPEESLLRELAEDLAGRPGPVYVHCAAGHGRAAMLAAVILLRRGLAEDVQAAEARMRARRPKVRMTRLQRRRAAAAARSPNGETGRYSPSPQRSSIDP